MRSSPFSASLYFRDPEDYARQRVDRPALMRLRAGRTYFTMVREPEAIWNVLVDDAGSYRGGRWKDRIRRSLGATVNTLDGEAHQERRRLIAPLMDAKRVTSLIAEMEQRAERMQEGWRDQSTIIARHEAQRMSLAVTALLLLSRDLEERADPLAPALAKVMVAVSGTVPTNLAPAWRRAIRRARHATSRLIDERLSSGEQHDDLLGAMLAADLPREVIEAEIIAMLMAAVAEPPRALEAAWYLLAQDPEADARLHAEVTQEGAPGARMPYLEAVVKETLRLFPPVRHIDRRPAAPLALGDQQLGATENVIVSPVVLHREPALYDRPDEFRPERWLTAGQDASRTRGAYLPFGAGRHACLGAALGRSVVSVTLARVARNWRLRLDDPAAADPRRAAIGFRLERRPVRAG